MEGLLGPCGSSLMPWWFPRPLCPPASGPGNWRLWLRLGLVNPTPRWLTPLLSPPQVELNIVAGYGSPKDVAVYAALGLPASQTYIVGRAVRKLQAQCQVQTPGLRAQGAGGQV